MEEPLLLSSLNNTDNFKLSYANTLYKIQGKSLLSYSIYEPDFIDIDSKRNFGKEAYTMISRLKTINL